MTVKEDRKVYRRPRGKVRLAANVYAIVEEAVESGARWGYVHAHKHLDDGQHPTEESLVEHVVRDVMLELERVVNFQKSMVAGGAAQGRKVRDAQA
jgi:hypothetical protein